MAAVKTLLLYTPITDPTAGYSSLSYLEAYARAQGHHDIRIMDTNIEAIHFMMQPDQTERLLQHARQLLTELGAKSQLNGAEQIAYYHAWLAQAFNPDDLSEAVATLRDPERFYSYHHYQRAAETMMLWVRCLSLLGFPGQFEGGFTLSSRGWLNTCMTADLVNEELLDRFTAPFRPYFEAVFLPHLKQEQYRLIGINVTYVYQLPFALWLARQIRQTCPSAFLVMGGTHVSGIWKDMLDRSRFWDICRHVDAVVVGEGESAFVHILDSLGSGETPAPHPNLLLHPRLTPEGTVAYVTTIAYEDIKRIPVPDYRSLPWDKYLSPEPVVYYSPSRGCYWNKCTFCDYGLNFGSPTAPWRALSVSEVMRDMRVIASTTRYVYFSVDVLAPSLLLDLAEQLAAEGLDIRWSAEIRLEKHWSKERCELLKRGGCVVASFGFESGNERILKLMNKGTIPHQIAETIRNFAEAGIGVQIMGFTGFPSETEEEAHESVRFLDAIREYWTFGGLGEFSLTPGALVRREADRFGITDVRPFGDEDIPMQLFYRDASAESARQNRESQDRLNSAKRMLNRAPFPRPFLGGVDAPHTMLYHGRYGTGVLDAIASPPIEAVTDETEVVLRGKILPELNGYAPDRLVRSVREYVEAAMAEGKSLGHADLMRELSASTVEKQPHDRQFFVRRDGTFFPIPRSLQRLLEAIDARGTVGGALSYLGAGEAERQLYRSLLATALRMNIVSIAGHQVAPATAVSYAS